MKYTPKNEAIAEIKIKHSRFIGRIKSIKNVKDAKDYISQISKKEKNANHNCWAYIIDENTFHYSDAGEPSGTAGKPIYNTLCKNNLEKTVAVVTRYFGGIKLGIRGLIDAYSQTVQETINNAELLPLIERVVWKIKTDYAFAEIFKYKCQKFNVEIINIEYSDKVVLECSAEKKYSKDFENYLYEMNNQKKMELLNKKEIEK